jgi:hypothetical protein
MSERKSWDIQPRKKAPPQPAPRPSAPAPSARPTSPRKQTRSAAKGLFARRPKEVRARRTTPAPSPRSRPVRSVDKRRVEHLEEQEEAVRATPAMRPKRVLQGKDREPLKNSRRRARNRLQVVLSVVFVVVIVGLYACIWTPAFRIQYVQAAGPDSLDVQRDTQNALKGTIEYVIPRNSIFFFPEAEIRAQLLTQYPDISAVSIARTSFDSVLLTSISRETAFVWCGASYSSSLPPDPIAEAVLSNSSSTESSTVVPASGDTDTSGTVLAPSGFAPSTSTCYDSDDQGFIFAVDSAPATDSLKVYGPLVSSTTMPLGMHVADGSSIPNALEFVKEIKSLGVPITALVLRGDEADLYAQSGTRITYVLGQEKAAVSLAASTFPSLDINDGSLEYVDLRFDDKVYFKKSGTDSSGSSDTPSQ